MQKITFGLEKHNDVRAVNIQTDSIDAVEFDINSEKGNFHVKIPAYGSHLAALAPAAVVIGQLLAMTNEEISNGFAMFAPVEGRSRVTNHKGITLIDDCYNANPNSVKAALTSISTLPGRHVAVLGDMLALGEHSEQMHREVGMFAAECDIDLLICHGEQAKFLYDAFNSAATENKEKAIYYAQIDELMENLPGKIKKGDAILVKASRGMHFEKLLPIITGN